MAQHAANRLNLADRMAKAGVSPEAILRALRIGGDLEARKQYHPDQPRDPAGSPTGGRWSANFVTGTPTLSAPSKTRPSPPPRPSPDDTPAPTTSEAQRSLTSDTTIGTLSIRYETGALPGQELQAAARVSSGVGDSGGVSYGAFQLCSALDKGQQVMAFLRSPYGSPWAQRFEGLDPTVADGAFGKVWRQIASADPHGFFQAQFAYIKHTDYDRVVRRVLKKTGLNLDEQSNAVKSAVFSMSVQHGRAAKVVIDAIHHLSSELKPSDPSFQKALVNALYDARTRYVVHIKQPKLAHRYIRERRDALALLR